MSSLSFAIRTLVLSVSLLAAAVLASAATLEVPADYPDIQAAIDVALPGDTVRLADGTYRGEGNRDLDFMGKALLLRSAAGNPSTCILDCEGSEAEAHRALYFHSGESSAARVVGITMSNGWAPMDHFTGGGAVLCEGASSPSFENCHFVGNHGSGLYSRDQSSPSLADCRFADNLGRKGGGIYASGGQHEILRCEFVGNEAQYAGGGLHGHAGTFDIQDCRFAENRAPSGAAIDMIYGCSVEVSRSSVENNLALDSFWSVIVNLHGMVDARFQDCTFYGNETEGNGQVLVTSKSSHGVLQGCTFFDNRLAGGTVVMLGEYDGRVENCIIAGNSGARALFVGEVLSLTCTDLYGNEGGDWVDGMELWLGLDGNISADPMFCDAEIGDLTLHADSPCAPAQSGCGLMGAWPVACGTTATHATSWSALKRLY